MTARHPSFRYLAIAALRSRGMQFASPPPNDLLIEECCRRFGITRTPCARANKRRVAAALMKLAQGPP